MSSSSYRRRIERDGAIKVEVPGRAERDFVNLMIYEELCVVRISPESRRSLHDIVTSMASSGSQAVIAGCTELSLVLESNSSPVPILDTARLHAAQLAEWSLESILGPGDADTTARPQ